MWVEGHPPPLTVNPLNWQKLSHICQEITFIFRWLHKNTEGFFNNIHINIDVETFKKQIKNQQSNIIVSVNLFYLVFSSKHTITEVHFNFTLKFKL